MNPELENLINMALADGEVTEKEKAIILRKAEKLGEDVDEVEMILDGKIALMQKEKSSIESSAHKSNKEGNLKRCPSCGAPFQSFKTKCPDCEYEFRNIQGTSSLQNLYEEFQRIEDSERSRERSWSEKLSGEFGIQYSVAKRQIVALSSFPVPNAKEDILEFISVAFAEASKSASWLKGQGTDPDYMFKKAWEAKCKQIITKARFLMKDDKKTMEEIENYAKQLKIK